MSRRGTNQGGRRGYRWARLSDEKLLTLRFADLGLTANSRYLTPFIKRLQRNLDRRDLGRFRPHCWLSTEWFSPDGVPGIAIPFYLAHNRLRQLEQRQVFEVEGGTARLMMKIFRHEAGHAIDSAYRLHRRKLWRETFGSFTQRYPQTYKPRPGSRDFVTHLPWWYAQAHPAEDFAETFAVWLSPGSKWSQRYKGWPARRKLEAVDQLMRQIADTPPPVRTRRQVEPISRLTTTLGEHYRLKKRRYADASADFYDGDLTQLFSADPRFASRQTAASFLREHRTEMRQTVARWTGTHAYTIDQVLREMIDRCKTLKLRLAVPRHRAQTEAAMMLTVQIMNFKQGGRHPMMM